VGFDSAVKFLNSLTPEERAALDVYGEDGGFATRPWAEVRFANEGIVLYGTTAVAIGNYYFTDLEGQDPKVHYTLGFILMPTALRTRSQRCRFYAVAAARSAAATA
jgi:hypothetical protein